MKKIRNGCFIILTYLYFIFFSSNLAFASSIVTDNSIKSMIENNTITGSSIGQIEQITPQGTEMENSIFLKGNLKETIELPIKIVKNREIIVEELPIGTNKLKLSMVQKKNDIIVKWQEIGKDFKYEVYLTEENHVEKLWKTTKTAKISLNLQTGMEYKIKVCVLNQKKKKVVSSEKYRIFLPKKVSHIDTCAKREDCVQISWKASENADHYIIYRKEKKKKYKKIGQSKQCSYLDKKIKSGKIYYYKIVPAKKTDVHSFFGVGTVKKFDNKKIVQINHQKYTYKEMTEDIQSLKRKYNGFIDYKIIGKSEDGRNIYDVILGNQKAEKSMLVVSTLHAREYMASLLCMNQIEYYLQNYNKDILDNIAIHYIPMANPDGVTISQLGMEQIRNEQMRNNLYLMAGDTTETWKANANGVDLNKNFPYEFEVLGEAGSEGFSGMTVASESETRAVLDLIKVLKEKYNLQGVINYHATGSIIFGNCKKEGEIKEVTKKMYQLAKNVTGYSSAKEYTRNTSKYGDAGNLREYLLYEENIPNITIEIGKIPCPAPISEFPSIWERNCDLVLKEAELFL